MEGLPKEIEALGAELRKDILLSALLLTAGTAALASLPIRDWISAFGALAVPPCAAAVTVLCAVRAGLLVKVVWTKGWLRGYNEQRPTLHREPVAHTVMYRCNGCGLESHGGQE